MNIQSFAIFQKDFKQLSRHAALALMVQAFIMALFPILKNQIGFVSLFDEWSLSNWFFKVQITITALIALIAAAYFMAEERSGNNVILLTRLPVSWTRIFSEKIAAGLSIVIVVCLVQALWFLVTLLFGVTLWESENKIFAYILSYSIFAYGVGVIISSKVKQTITVLLCGIVIVFISMMVAHHYAFQTKIGVYYFYPLFLLVFTIPFGASMGILKLRHSLNSTIRFKTEQLLWLQIKQNWTSLILGVFFIIVSVFGFATNSDLIVSLSLVGSVLLSIYIGISTYKNNEKHGQQNVLFYQPISLSEIFWAKWLSGLVLALVPALCIMFVIFGINTFEFNNAHSNRDREKLIIFFCLPLIGLGLFACAALFTHAIRNTLYAFLECIPAFLSVSLVYCYLQFGTSHITDIATSITKRKHIDMLDIIPGIPWIILALFIGIILTTWRTATDHSVLTGSTMYRQLYVGRIFLFMLSVIVIIFNTGWLDLIYLLTGIELGMG